MALAFAATTPKAPPTTSGRPPRSRMVSVSKRDRSSHFSAFWRSSRSMRSEVACARRVWAMVVSVWVRRSRVFSSAMSSPVGFAMRKSTPGRSSGVPGRYSRGSKPETPASMTSADGFEHDHRDLAFGLRLVVGETGELLLLQLPDTGALLPRRHPGPHLGRCIGADLDNGLGVGQQVVIPGGVGRRAALGGEDHEVVAVAPEGQRVDALRTRLGSGVVQQEDRDALERAADDAVIGPELLNDLSVPFVAFTHASMQRNRRRCYSRRL